MSEPAKPNPTTASSAPLTTPVNLGAVWRPLRGPFQRWPQLTDLTLAVLSLLMTLIMWSSRSGRELLRLEHFTDVAAVLLVFSASVALLWRRSHPWQVHALAMLATVTIYFATPVHGVVALAVSLYSLGRYEARRTASLLGVLAAVLFILLDRAVINPLTAGGTMTAVLAACIWYVGRRLRFRAEYLRLLEERAHHLEREQHAEAERAVVAERSRIAREMHDVVAHQLSLMTVQAGAARTIARTDPQAAMQAMAAVEEAGRRALTEMRQLLSVLRPQHASVELVPQPGVHDLPALIEQVNNVGPQVTFRCDDSLAELPARLDLTLYRLVQEALTNVVKHAGQNVQMSVAIESHKNSLRVTVRDNGQGPSRSSTSGHGLIGMRERVELLGGTFVATATETGGFEVSATLPRTQGDNNA